jgi:hypothetical protein
MPGFLANYRMLLLSYEGQKPPRPELHNALVGWVKGGGTLVVVDNDKDPYNGVREWWNTGDMHDASPRLDLFRRLGLPAAPDGPQHVGKGTVVYSAESPAALSHRQGGAQAVRDLCASAAKAGGIDWQESSALVLHRGPYIVAAALPSATEPIELTGRFIPLFDPGLPVLNHVIVRPDQRQLLVDLDRLGQPLPCVAAASGRVTGETRNGGNLSFAIRGIDDTQSSVRIACERKPASVVVGGKALADGDWSFADGVLRLHFKNEVEGTLVEIKQ